MWLNKINQMHNNRVYRMSYNTLIRKAAEALLNPEPESQEPVVFYGLMGNDGPSIHAAYNAIKALNVPHVWSKESTQRSNPRYLFAFNGEKQANAALKVFRALTDEAIKQAVNAEVHSEYVTDIIVAQGRECVEMKRVAENFLARSSDPYHNHLHWKMAVNRYLRKLERDAGKKEGCSPVDIEITRILDVWSSKNPEFKSSLKKSIEHALKSVAESLDAETKKLRAIPMYALSAERKALMLVVENYASEKENLSESAVLAEVNRLLEPDDAPLEEELIAPFANMLDEKLPYHPSLTRIEGKPEYVNNDEKTWPVLNYGGGDEVPALIDITSPAFSLDNVDRKELCMSLATHLFLTLTGLRAKKIKDIIDNKIVDIGYHGKNDDNVCVEKYLNQAKSEIINVFK